MTLAELGFLQAMLYNVFDEDDEKRRKLAALLRLFVNLLRSGHLITTDIVRVPSCQLRNLHNSSLPPLF